MELTGRADPALGVGAGEVLAEADVVVDFTVPDTALANVRACLEAGRPRRRRHHRLRPRRRPRRGRGIAGQLLRRAQLRDRRGAADGGLTDDRHAHARVRDRRAASRQKARRALGHREANPGADRRRGRQRPPADPLGPPAGAGRPSGSDLRRRGPDARRSATTRSTAAPSCPASCSPAAGWRSCPIASRSGWRSCCRCPFAWRLCRSTGYPAGDDGDPRDTHRDGDPVRRAGPGRHRRRPASGDATCSSTARTAWSSRRRPASGRR